MKKIIQVRLAELVRSQRLGCKTGCYRCNDPVMSDQFILTSSNKNRTIHLCLTCAEIMNFI